jgi:eukaryotic-like serine/threonine-protein kinase
MQKTRLLFRNSALLSGLVNQTQFDEANSRALKLNPSNVQRIEAEGAAIAAQLLEMGVLTRYQADQILAGRTKFKLGPYIVTDWIGQGGMGQVYKAVHEIMGRECAVKVLPMHKATPDSINNFHREIRTQAQLDHTNLVRAFDAGHDGNVHYLVTEYVPGTDLRRLVRTQGELSIQHAASIILQAAQGLEHAHSRGLIHRDVKPGNILVTPQGIAKVSDLGLAGFMDHQEDDPRAGKIVGTADYIAPELIRSPGDANSASDIYSLGCTLYYAICGKVPFPGGTTKEKARRHCEETPWHPRRFNPEIPEEFVEIVADMMEKNPRDRIQSATELIPRLEPWAAETSALVTKKLSKSPWSAPPPPSGREDEDDLPQESEAGQESSYAGSGQISQVSQATQTPQGASHETTPDKPAHKSNPLMQLSSFSIPFLQLEPLRPDVLNYILITVAITAPIAMVFGALLASFVFWLRS